ncbi:MAG TPA: TerB family tellurite resistance protein [Thermoanaerobaculia bacterium]|nr:TerB family tellurite resistance protein [Thermoanaerobaculia bacterium]
MSFARLVDRIKEGLAPSPSQTQPSHEERLRLATAAVLLDIAYADGSFTPAEGGNVVDFLQRTFALGTDDARELIEAAAEIRDHTIDHFAMTNYIRKNVALDERIEIVKTMWRTAYADGRLSEHENYLVRKLADLLGLEHHVMIDAKVSVLRELEAQ